VDAGGIKGEKQGRTGRGALKKQGGLSDSVGFNVGRRGNIPRYGHPEKLGGVTREHPPIVHRGSGRGA